MISQYSGPCFQYACHELKPAVNGYFIIVGTTILPTVAGSDTGWPQQNAAGTGILIPAHLSLSYL